MTAACVGLREPLGLGVDTDGSRRRVARLFGHWLRAVCWLGLTVLDYCVDSWWQMRAAVEWMVGETVELMRWPGLASAGGICKTGRSLVSSLADEPPDAELPYGNGDNIWQRLQERRQCAIVSGVSFQ